MGLLLLVLWVGTPVVSWLLLARGRVPGLVVGFLLFVATGIVSALLLGVFDVHGRYDLFAAYPLLSAAVVVAARVVERRQLSQAVGLKNFGAACLRGHATRRYSLIRPPRTAVR